MGGKRKGDNLQHPVLICYIQTRLTSGEREAEFGDGVKRGLSLESLRCHK